MNTNELLTKMGDTVFGSLYHDEICAIFAQDVEAGKYGSEEKEYKAAIFRWHIQLEKYFFAKAFQSDPSSRG